MYVISSPGHEAKRRYSEFEALREALVALHPTLVIPPIPPKHTIADYALKQNKAKNDPVIIARRKRMLERFLRRLHEHPVLRQDVVFRCFLDPRFSWHEISHSPPLTTLPKDNLLAPPANPADPNVSPSYAILPLPSVTTKLKTPNIRFQDSDTFTNRFQSLMSHVFEPADRRITRRWLDIAADYGELGAAFNAQSLSEKSAIAAAVERTGQAADTTHIAISDMLREWEAKVTEPFIEYTQYGHILQKIIKWRHLKQQQLETAEVMLADKRQVLSELERIENESARLNMALEHGGRGLVSSHVRSKPPMQSVYGRAAEADESFGESVWGDDATHPQQDAPAEPEQPAPPSPVTSTPPPAAPPAPQRRTFFSALSERFQSVMDVDSDKTRQSMISRLREELHFVRDVSAAPTDTARRGNRSVDQGR